MMRWGSFCFGVMLIVASAAYGQQGVDSERPPDLEREDTPLDLPPLEARSSRQWRRFLIDWRDRVLAQSPTGAALPEDEVQLLKRVRDDAATSEVVRLYKSTQDGRIDYLLLQTLATINSKRSVDALITISLSEAAGRKNAAKQIARTSHAQRARDAYARALRSDKNLRWTLEAIQESKVAAPMSPGDELDKGFVTALIDTLWVEETRWVERDIALYYRRPNPGTTAGWNHHAIVGTTAFPMKHPVPCEPVRRLLEDHIAHGYGYDQNAWRIWIGKEPSHRSRNSE